MKVCSECGVKYPRGGSMCCMSRDGEGPHRWEGEIEEASPVRRAIAEHLEQGAAEK